MPRGEHDSGSADDPGAEPPPPDHVGDPGAEPPPPDHVGDPGAEPPPPDHVGDPGAEPPSSGPDDDGEDLPPSDPPGVPATPRNRAKSAALWGLVGGFAFLVLAQGYLLLGGELPFPYAWLFGVAGVVALGSGGLTYLAEHRVAKRRT